MPSTVIDRGDFAVNKIDENYCPCEVYILVEDYNE